MTKQEIEKAAIIYDRELKKHPLSAEALREDLSKFGQIVNKHWQEKTRWIPIEERLPVFGGKRRTILVKTGDDLYSFLWIIQEVSLSDFECQGYTHWKEIE